MDTLEIRLETLTDRENDYVLAEVLVNGDALVDYSYFATDLEMLVASAQDSGEFFIITCWCGVPGCAGLYRGIDVRREPDLVHWRVSEPEPRRSFTFQRDAYDSAIQGAIKECKRWLSTRLHSQSSARPLSVMPETNGRFFTLVPNDK